MTAPTTPQRRPRGRPVGSGVLPPEVAHTHPVRVYLDESEVAELDRRRGMMSRSAWMARVTGLRRWSTVE
jgi:hypothetical protein